MELTRAKHIAFFKRHLILFPTPYEEHDCERTVLAFFCLLGLDLLNALNTIDDDDKKSWIEWIYKNYVTKESKGIKYSGFQAYRTGIQPISFEQEPQLAGTVFSICCLLFLGDNLSRIDRDLIKNFVELCKTSQGHFRSIAVPSCSDQDMRQLYMATTIASLLDFSLSDPLCSIQYIKSCQRYEGGFSLLPYGEAHAGATFCALASWSLILKMIPNSSLDTSNQSYNLMDCVPKVERLIRWLTSRQLSSGGLNGRTNKDVDTCYAYWVLSSLKLLDALPFIDGGELEKYLLLHAQHALGGFSKTPGEFPDVLHSALGLYAMAYQDDKSFPKVNADIHMTSKYINICRDCIQAAKGK